MRKIIDERGRLFGIISVIDIIVVAVAAVLVAAVLLRTAKSESPSSSVKTIPVTYTARIYDVRKTSAALLRPGDKVFTNSGIYIGTIKAVSSDDAWVTTLLADGTHKKARSYERYDVTLTIETQCSIASDRYYADRTYELCVNNEQKIVTKYVDTSFTILEIKDGYFEAVND